MAHLQGFVQSILHSTKDSELIQSYVRLDDSDGHDSEKDDIAVETEKSRLIKQSSLALLPNITTGILSGSLQATQKRDIYTPAERRRETSNLGDKQLSSYSLKSEHGSGKHTRSTSRQADHEKDLSVTVVKAVKLKKGRRRKRRGPRNEEVYTDKDRAAAVNMGSRDIKHSLSMKRREERSKALQIPEEADPSTFLALGSRELRGGDFTTAIGFVNKALELNPGDKDALVARSQCYILLGEPQKALDDAETALKIDKNFVTALYQKAESLYFLGRFEHSLMYYHRGLRIRPELHKFRLGVQKAQEAIENMIGSSVKLGACLNGSKDVRRPKSDAQNTDKVKVDVNKNSLKPIEESVKRNNFLPKTPTIKQSQKNDDTKSNKKVKNKKSMGALDIDKEYFEKLIHHPDIKCLDKENTVIVEKAKEAVNYLNNRKEFWRQQLPTANNTTRKNGSSIISHR